MKNPLIEAIRQAGDDSTASQEPSGQDTTIDVVRDPANDENALDTDELALMETAASLDVGDQGHGLEPEPDPDPEPEPEHEPKFEDADSADPETDEPVAERVADTGQDNAGKPGRQDQRLRGLPAIGRVAPLLCLLFAGSSAAIYIAYQALGGGYDGSDLSAMSARALAADRLSDSDNESSGPPPSPFPLEPSSRQAAEPVSQTAPKPKSYETQPRVASPAAETTAAEPMLTSSTGSEVDMAFPILEVAYEAFANGDLDAAESGYRRALQISPHHPNALEGLGALLMKSNRRAEALNTFERLLSVDPHNVAASAALLTAGSGDGEATESAIKHLVQRYPGSPHLRFALGAHYASSARWPEARLAFEAAHRLDPDNAEYVYNLAVSFEHLGRPDNAARHYELALASIGSTSSLDAEQVTARLERLALAMTGPEPSQ